MANLTADEVYAQLSAVIDKWHNYLDEKREWIGGPDADNDVDPAYVATPGQRPLTDDAGNTGLVDTPAELKRRIDAAIAGLGLGEDPATFEARVNATLAEMETLKADLLVLQSDLDTALPLAQSAMDSANATQAQVDTIYQDLLNMKNSANLSEDNALVYAQTIMSYIEDARAAGLVVEAERVRRITYGEAEPPVSGDLEEGEIYLQLLPL